MVMLSVTSLAQCLWESKIWSYDIFILLWQRYFQNKLWYPNLRTLWRRETDCLFFFADGKKVYEKMWQRENIYRRKSVEKLRGKIGSKISPGKMQWTRLRVVVCYVCLALIVLEMEFSFQIKSLFQNIQVLVGLCVGLRFWYK